MVFLGYTNSGGVHEALFELAQPIDAAISPPSIYALKSTNPPGVPIQASAFSRVMRGNRGLVFATKVDSTNHPLRFVFAFQTRAVGTRRVVEKVKELSGRLVGNEREFFTGSKYFVTNDVRPWHESIAPSEISPSN
jgi:hypothetical protein